MRRRAAAAILAGGQSRRMGADKALVLLDGRSLLARVIELLRPLFTEIAIIGGDAAAYRQFGLPVFPDHHPGAGALGGICTALLSAEAPLVFCCGCDMPFLKPAIVEHLLELARGDFEAVVPQVRGESEPLCAVYSRGALEVIEEEIAAGHRRIKDALACVSDTLKRRSFVRRIPACTHSSTSTRQRSWKKRGTWVHRNSRTEGRHSDADAVGKEPVESQPVSGCRRSRKAVHLFILSILQQAVGLHSIDLPTLCSA